MSDANWFWLPYGDRVGDEMRQSAGEGKDVSTYAAEAEKIASMEKGAERESLALDLLKKLNSVPSKHFNYIEPDDYAGLKSVLPEGHDKTYGPDWDALNGKLKGAWLGRAIGCLLGIPVEGWHKDKIKDFLTATDNYPLNRYMSSDVPAAVRERFNIADYDTRTPYDRQKTCWINNVTSFPVDDDMNYTVSALRVAERCGLGFTSLDIAKSWLYSIPALHLCTAERVAYQNLMNLLPPPESGQYLNPFREWIGAQIRADFFGYIAPGNPRLAAKMAYTDGVVTHVKNGVYGEMLIAAVISLSAVSGDMVWVVKEALKQIPPKSRLTEKVSEVVKMFEEKKSFAETVEYIRSLFDERISFDWCLTVPNAMIVTACILYFAGDYSAAVTNAVMSGFDTDCNGATVGSILGMSLGAAAIPAEWLNGIKPVVNTSVHGYYALSVDELTERTLKLAVSARE